MPSKTEADLTRQRARLVDEIEVEVRETQKWIGRERLSPRVVAAMAKVPRHRFLAPGDVGYAYLNRPWTIGFGVSIPWNSDKTESAIREAELRRSVAASRVAAVEAKTSADIRKLYFRVENARRLVELYEQTLIPQAERAMAEAEAWAEGSPKSVAAFLETQSVWLNFHLARLRALTDHEQNVARLERVVGVALTNGDHEEGGP